MAVLVVPEYASPDVLPYASDILYHGRLVYTMPTGIAPEQADAVASFPEYCKQHDLAMAPAVWQLLRAYWDNAPLAGECVDLLRPFGDRVAFWAVVYARDETAIERARSLLTDHPDLMDAFAITEWSVPFLAREIMSHVLFELRLERGIDHAARYLQEHLGSFEKFVDLAAAVMTNRVSALASVPFPIILYKETWWPFVTGVQDARGAPIAGDEEGRTEFLTHKIFEAVLLPIFGRCDDAAKNSQIATLIDRQEGSGSQALRKTCEEISQELIALNAPNTVTLQTELNRLIDTRIADPLASFLNQPTRTARAALGGMLTDTGLLTAALMAALSPSTRPAALPLAAVSGYKASFNILRSLFKSGRERPPEPLISGMKAMSAKEKEVAAGLKSITAESLGFGTVI